MEKKMTVNVPMFRVVDDNAIFVKAAIMDKYANEHDGLFLLDSGSTDNSMSYKFKELIGELCWSKGVANETYTVGNAMVKEESINFNFVLGGIQFHEEFSISPKYEDENVGDLPIFGILGNGFFRKYNLALDYAEHRVYTSQVDHTNLCIADCEYFFPMQCGLDNFGIPVVPLKGEKQELVAMVDTGSNANQFSEGAIKDNCIKYTLTGEHIKHQTIAGQHDAEAADVSFTLLGLSEDCSYEEYPRQDMADVVSIPFISTAKPNMPADSDDNPAIYAILGSPFIGKEGWVLDFGAKIIFKRK